MHAAPQAVPALRAARFELVPGTLTEAQFWRHFFLRVLRERRLAHLPPLIGDAPAHRGSPPPASPAHRGSPSPASTADAAGTHAASDIDADTPPSAGAGSVRGGPVAPPTMQWRIGEELAEFAEAEAADEGTCDMHAGTC